MQNGFKEYIYPEDWVYDIPSEPEPGSNQKASNPFSSVAYSNQVSTSIEIKCEPGETPSGGTILSYSEYFVPSKEEQEKGKKPRYSLFVKEDSYMLLLVDMVRQSW